MSDGLHALFAVDGGSVLVAPDHGEHVNALLRAVAAHSKAEDLLTSPMAQDNFWPAQGDWRAAYRPYEVKAGVLHIPVKGVLLHNFPYALGSYATGYYYIQKAMERGLVDPEVKGIALVCDTPGGMVAGCFELCDRIHAARSVKPIQAFAHEHAFSAGYAVASAASKITVSKTGGVGSIGVVTAHTDLSKRMEAEGVKITFIFAGKHKVDGNPYEALSADAKERIQKRIDATYAIFVEQVARNRKMKESAVRATEALTFGAAEAVDQGLADKVGPLDEALADFAAYLCGSNEGEDQMSQEQKDAAGAAANEQAVAAARTAGSAEGVKAERARIAGIKALDEAKKRPAAADALAMDSDMSVEQAKAFLAKLPEEAPAAAAETTTTNAGSKGFDKVMEQEGKSGVGAGNGDTQKDDRAKDDEVAQRILANTFGAKASA